MAEKIRDLLLSPYPPANLPDVVGESNALLRGSGLYRRWGESRRVFSKVDSYVCRRFALYLARKNERKGNRLDVAPARRDVDDDHRFLKALDWWRLSGTEHPYRKTATA